MAAPPFSLNIRVRKRRLPAPSPHDPRLAERFELFVAGVEIANGFGELTDPVEQRARLEAEMNKKMRLYGERYPLDEDFLAALGSMPPASGCALGFDRLVMLATGAASIDQVIWTPLESRRLPLRICGAGGAKRNVLAIWRIQRSSRPRRRRKRDNERDRLVCRVDQQNLVRQFDEIESSSSREPAE